MRRSCIALVSAAAALMSTPTFAAPLTPGNLLVYRVGTPGGQNLTSAGTPVTIDEYTTAGKLVQEISIPSDKFDGFTASGTAVSEGLLTVSTNLKYVLFTGYKTIGFNNIASSTADVVPRAVGRISVVTGDTDTSTVLTGAFSSNNIRGVASTDGNAIWASGASGGVYYTTFGSKEKPTLVSDTVPNLRALQIVDGQLYASSGSSGVSHLGTVGTGLPTTTGQKLTSLPGFPAAGSQYAFFFADLSKTVKGVDTLYVADDAEGITKYSLKSGDWVSNGTVGSATAAYRGLTGVVSSDGKVTLFAVGGSGSGLSGGGDVRSFSDDSGYDGAFSSDATYVFGASKYTAFRGIAYLPSAVPEPGIGILLLAGLLAMGFNIKVKPHCRMI